MTQIPGDIAVAVDASGATVSVAGDLDIASAPTFLERALPLLDRHEDGDLVLDMTSVAFCDSSGITALIQLRKRCAERGWRMRTVHLQPEVSRIVVDFGGLGDYLNVE